MEALAARPPAPVDREAFLKLASYPLVRQSDMSEEARAEAVDLCTSAVEKFQDNLEKAAQAVKEAMDRKFGAPWNAVVGEAFAFEITYEMKHLLYLFLGGTKGVLVWKSA